MLTDYYWGERRSDGKKPEDAVNFSIIKIQIYLINFAGGIRRLFLAPIPADRLPGHRHPHSDIFRRIRASLHRSDSDTQSGLLPHEHHRAGAPLALASSPISADHINCYLVHADRLHLLGLFLAESRSFTCTCWAGRHNGGNSL